LTTLALAARETSTVRLGTAVVPAHPHHPLVLAAAALTAQSAADGRLTLGIGASHRFMVEDVWGYSYARPAGWMREYIAALAPALRGERPALRGGRVTAAPPRPLQTPGASEPPLILAAMGPLMLAVAGEMCNGTVTWLAGAATLRDHVVPRIRAAAEDASRLAPAIIAGLPVCVTDDVAAARELARTHFAPYSAVPSYRAVLDLEGAAEAGDVAVIGSEDDIGAALDDLRDAGVTEFMACVFGDGDQRERTIACLTRAA
jgi:F420-dependent oxidoreductase-like protein